MGRQPPRCPALELLERWRRVVWTVGGCASTVAAKTMFWRQTPLRLLRLGGSRLEACWMALEWPVRGLVLLPES